jgi:hypothetical protein
MKILNEIGNLILLLIAVVLGSILLPIGILWNVYKSILKSKGYKFLTTIKLILLYWLRLLYQVWVVIKQTFLYVAYLIDLLGNVILGELLESTMSKSPQHLFGRGEITISAALGYLKRRNELTLVGKILCKILNKLDPHYEDHCISSIELYEYKESLKTKSKK